MDPGMGYLPGIAIDQHFAQRGRLGRLLAALVLHPAVLGLGIDADTAIIVKGDEFEGVGQGAITVVDESTATYNNLGNLLKDEAIALCGVKLHILPHGYRFNLKTHLSLINTSIPDLKLPDLIFDNERVSKSLNYFKSSIYF